MQTKSLDRGERRHSLRSRDIITSIRSRTFTLLVIALVPQI